MWGLGCSLSAIFGECELKDWRAQTKLLALQVSRWLSIVNVTANAKGRSDRHTKHFKAVATLSEHECVLTKGHNRMAHLITSDVPLI